MPLAYQIGPVLPGVLDAVIRVLLLTTTPVSKDKDFYRLGTGERSSDGPSDDLERLLGGRRRRGLLGVRGVHAGAARPERAPDADGH